MYIYVYILPHLHIDTHMGQFCFHFLSASSGEPIFAFQHIAFLSSFFQPARGGAGHRTDAWGCHGQCWQYWRLGLMGAVLVWISHDPMQDEDIKFCQFGRWFFHFFSQVWKCDERCIHQWYVYRILCVFQQVAGLNGVLHCMAWRSKNRVMPVCMGACWLMGTSFIGCKEP